MPDLADITAICVDTLNHELALSACEKMSGHGFAQIVLVTDDAIGPHLRKRPIPDLRVETHPPLPDRNAYSRYVLHSLVEHVHTPWALIFQWDGYVLDADRWRPEFLDYDYVGGLFPPDIAARFGRWVGNGGFCLRSKRLMQIVSQLAPPDSALAEDAVICALLAETLEKEHGLRFAPAEVAMHFSNEHMQMKHHREQAPQLVTDDTFGFHGFFNFHLVFDDEELLHLTEHGLGKSRSNILTSWPAAGLLQNLFNANRKSAAVALAIQIAPLLGLDPYKATFDEICLQCNARGRD